MSIFNSFKSLPPVTLNLLIINCLVFVASMALPSAGLSFMNDWALVHPVVNSHPELQAVYGSFKPFQLITHMFMHGGLFHIFCNMLVLSFAGRAMEVQWGPQKFLAIYFLSGIAAAAMQIGSFYPMNFLHSVIPQLSSSSLAMVGASGATSGILFAFIANNMHIRLQLLFPPIPISALKIKWLMIVGSLIFGLVSLGNIAHFAHLGGALMGYFLAKYWMKDRITLLS